MIYKYRIYHSEENKALIDQSLYPLSVDQQVNEYDQLPDFLSRYFSSGEITAEFKVVSDGVIVAVSSNKTEHEVRAELAKPIITLNNQIKGLCLILDRLDA